MATIYVADDDKDILRLVEIFMKNEGYIVETFTTGDDLYKRFKQEKCDLVILDVMMPGSDGFMICEKIRSISTVPIIILTAKDTDADYIVGISLGSDDYLVKPFKPTILTMKVKALLRRVEMNNNNTNKGVISCGNVSFDHESHLITINNMEVNFTKLEFNCLSYLLTKVNIAVSREELLQKVWSIDTIVETRVTDETIRKIRKKLKDNQANIEIKNVWGYGYRLEEHKDENS